MALRAVRRALAIGPANWKGNYKRLYFFLHLQFLIGYNGELIRKYKEARAMIMDPLVVMDFPSMESDRVGASGENADDIKRED
jgi:hypothetical protein